MPRRPNPPVRSRSKPSKRLQRSPRTSSSSPGPSLAAIHAEVDTLLAARIKACDDRAVEIVQRASIEATEIVARARRTHEQVSSLAEEVTLQSEAFLNLTEPLLTSVEDIRRRVASEMPAIQRSKTTASRLTPPPGQTR